MTDPVAIRVAVSGSTSHGTVDRNIWVAPLPANLLRLTVTPRRSFTTNPEEEPDVMLIMTPNEAERLIRAISDTLGQIGESYVG